MTIPNRRRLTRLGTCCKISVGKRETIPTQSGFGTQRFASGYRLEGSLIRTSFQLRWNYHQVANARVTCSVLPGWTDLLQTVKVLRPSRGLSGKGAY
jgi:hypothetical protein